MPGKNHTNSLIHASSPYLLQHAHNPVDWHVWSETTLAKARSLDKMLLISVGYSACHWCHVMERESFEDEAVAAIMNKHFICIKVDREERPDVDQVYMNAVQLITGSGGWPLNCFALPDGRPFFGGTYFRKEQWVQLLENIALLYSKRRKELEEQAASLTEGVKGESMIGTVPAGLMVTSEEITDAALKITHQTDPKEGGLKGAPKFPMPVVFSFLLKYTFYEPDESISDVIRLTLRKMAYGGIYDQLGGGFARYSTDSQWRVPHFEKMLYDNAQLVSLYAEAWHAYGDSLFKEIAEETVQFILRDLRSPEGWFYASLDADAEGEEGKYYTWGSAAFNLVLGNQADLLKRYYHVGGKGFWESGQNILLRTQSPEEFARSQGLQPSAFKAILKPAKAKLLKARGKRPHPGLDNKLITSWNGMMLKGLADSYRCTGNAEYLAAARKNAGFFIDNVIQDNGRLTHTWNPGKAEINGFLEDYAFLAEGLCELYQVTFDENYLHTALKLAEYAIRHFYNPANGLFFVTSGLDRELIARKQDMADNVTPSANSVMARVLFMLAQAFDRTDLQEMSERMLAIATGPVNRYPTSFANWAAVMLNSAYPFHTVAITGPDCLKTADLIRKQANAGIFFCGSTTQSNLPVLQNRFVENQTMIFVCTGKECKLPTPSIEQALKYLLP
jgi:uncharacterized protein YyaL (SSP411 family)